MHDAEQQQAALERKRHALEAQITALRAEFAANEVEAKRLILQSEQRQESMVKERQEMEHSRRADPATAAGRNKK